MKLINNRFRIEKSIEEGYSGETYLVVDLWDKEKKYYMRLLNAENYEKVINCFIDDFLVLSTIKHKFLLSSQYFSLVESINLKNTSMIIHFLIMEYIDKVNLFQEDLNLNLNQRLYIILDLMNVLDYLHFRGIVYKQLSPSNIFIMEDKSIKIMDLSSVVENNLNSYYDDLTRYFVAPEVITNNQTIDIKADYYSLGMMMKYLLFKNYLDDSLTYSSFKDEINLDKWNKQVLLGIIDNLTSKDPTARNIALRNHIDKVIKEFNLGYKYDLKEERSHLPIKTKIVGREEHLDYILSIDSQFNNINSKYNIALVKGNLGSGKSRLLEELRYQLKIRGRLVYHCDIKENDNLGIFNISNLLKQATRNTSPEILNRYDEIRRLLPEFIGEDNMDIDFTQQSEKYRLFNRINNLFSELSREKPIYLIIDDLHKANDLFISFIDYLISNINSKKMFFIISSPEEDYLINNCLFVKKTMNWILSERILELKLSNLSEKNTGEMIKNTLGISYVPEKFAAALFRESQGNPRTIDYLIKDLINSEELFIDKYGCWELNTQNYSQIHLPTDINEAIQTQLNRIKGDYLSIIKAISIFNNDVSKRTLVKMINMDIMDLDYILNDLVGESLIVEKVSDWGYDYSIFSNDLKRLVYYKIPEEEKLILHKEAFNVLFQLYGSKINLILDELINHLLKSKDYEKAIDLILIEASKIENKYSSNSIYLWEQAYFITKDNPSEKKLKVLDTLVDIYSVKGNIEKLEEYLNELVIESTRTNNYKYLIKSKYYKADNYLKKNDGESLIKEVLEMEKLSINYNYYEGLIMALVMKCRYELDSTNVTYIENILNRALTISKEHSIDKYLGTIYNIMGLSYYLRGNTEKAIEFYKESIKSFEDSGNIIEVTKPINNIGNIYSEIYGDNDESLKYYQKGLEITEKYGFTEASIVFLNNIGELYLSLLDYDNALEHIELSRKLSMETENFFMIFLTNVNLGTIYLSTGKYDSAYNCYNYLKEIYLKNPISLEEINSQYYFFLGEIYKHFGLLDEAIKYFEMTSGICKDYNSNQYLRAQSRVIYCKYFREGFYDREEIEHIIEQYKDFGFDYDKIIFILYFTSFALRKKDNSLVEYLLSIFESIDYKFKNDYIKDIVKLLEYGYIDISENINEMERIFENFNSFPGIDVKMYAHMIFGLILFEEKIYAKAIKHLLESLDLMCRSAALIPVHDLKYTFIRANKGDLMKEKVSKAIQQEFNKKVEYVSLDEVVVDDFNSYFNLNSLLEVLTYDEFNQILFSAEEDYVVKNIEDLLYLLGNDYKKNLDLILKHLGKETLADRGYILVYDEIINNFVPISSIREGENFSINESVLIQANRNNLGILINKNFKNINSSQYLNFLSDNLIGIICVPINIIEEDNLNIKDRRKREALYNKKNMGFIYLETSSSLNRFDIERFKLVSSLSSLAYLNIENNNLKLISTIDKLTGTLTRKYFDNEFNNLLKKYKNSEVGFSILMIDVDKFKEINDTYGHLKGDEVLSIIGNTIKSNIRTSDIVCRYGGEEFIVLLLNTTGEDAMIISEKLRTKMQNSNVSGIHRPVTISVGVAQYPIHGQFREELIGRADQALYHAKEILGRNKCVLWNPDISNTSNRMDRLAGIMTGNTDIDNRNILAILDVIDLIKNQSTIEDKAFLFLGRVLETIDGEYSSIVLVDDIKGIKEPLSRKRKNPNWVTTSNLNMDMIYKVEKSKKGEFLIDWDNIENIDSITGVPNWQSIIVLPMIKEDVLKGVVYISVPLKEKEFSFNDFNISKVMANMFASNL